MCVWGGVASVIRLLVGRVATKMSFSNPSISESFHQAQCPSCGSGLIHSSTDLRVIYWGALGFRLRKCSYGFGDYSQHSGDPGGWALEAECKR